MKYKLFIFYAILTLSWIENEPIYGQRPPAYIGITSPYTQTPIETLEMEISKLLNLPLYSASLSDGANFLSLVFPSPAFAWENIEFSRLPFDSIIHSTTLLRHASLFAIFVNQVVDAPHPEQVRSELSAIQTTESKALQQMLLCPDNNSSFNLSLISPFPLNETSWIHYTNTKMQLDTLSLQDTTLSVSIPYFSLCLELNRLKIARPWFTPIPAPSHIDVFQHKEELPNPRAYLSEIIICKNLKMERYQEQIYTIHFDENSRLPKLSIKPSEQIEAAGICILGGIYTLYKH